MDDFGLRIKKDNADLEDAVRAAKNGNFTIALKFLRGKPHLINCIPESRAWGILHQSVYWNRPDIVKEILAIIPCDVLIKTKIARNNDATPSSTPKQIAEQMKGREEIKQILQAQEDNQKASRFSKKLDYVVSTAEKINLVEHLPLFGKALAQYKKTLLGTTHPKEHLIDLLKQLIKEEEYNWEKVEHELHLAMYGVDANAAKELKDTYGTEKEFFEAIVRFYTGNYHKIINNAVSRDFTYDGQSKVNPTAADTAIALYDLLLDMVILAWDVLKAVDCLTYRGVMDQRLHNIGDRIMFTHFLSSSKSKQTAKNFAGHVGTLFTFDNSGPESGKSIHQPKNIKMLALHEEEECLYGIGAEFKVIDVDTSKSLWKITLKLIN